MNLGDLLSELRENMLHDRSSQVAGASDYLWSDATLIRYIDQAQRRFARRTLCIRDKTTAQCCQFKTVVGKDEYPLDPSVISVLSVQMTGDVADLARAGHSDFQTYRQPDTYFFDPGMLSSLPPGKPLAYGTDEGLAENDFGSVSVVTLRLFPMVGTGYGNITGKLRVCRMPLVNLHARNMHAIPEIPSDYHLDMLDWAAYLALRMPDIDAGDNALARAEAFRDSFEGPAPYRSGGHVGECIREMKRKLFTPMQWGFGRSGYSWVSSDG